MALPSHGSSGTSKTSPTTSATNPSSDGDMAQVFKDLARGEQTAQVLESSLTSLERKLDDFLASFEESERQRVNVTDGEKTSCESNDKKS